MRGHSYHQSFTNETDFLSNFQWLGRSIKQTALSMDSLILEQLMISCLDVILSENQTLETLLEIHRLCWNWVYGVWDDQPLSNGPSLEKVLCDTEILMAFQDEDGSPAIFFLENLIDFDNS